MSKLYRGTYVGERKLLAGKTAYVKIISDDRATAQFDDLTLPTFFTHGWTIFKKEEFDIEEPEDV